MRILAAILLILALASSAFAFDSNNPGVGAGVTGGNCTAGQFVTGINSSGLPTCQTPAGTLPGGSPPQIIGFSALNVAESQTIGGDATATRTGANALGLTVTRINGITPGGTCGANTWVSTISASGVPTCTQPAAASITGLGALATLNVGTGLTSSGGNLNLTTPVSIANGGRGSGTAPSAGQIDVAQSATVISPVSMSGDGTISAAGAFTLTKTTFASPTFTGTMTFPDASTYTSAGHNTMKALGIGQAVGTDPIDITNNVNAISAVHSVNTNASTAAQTEFDAVNATHAVNWGISGTGFTPTTQIPADSGYIYDTANGGLSLFVNNSTAVAATNGAFSIWIPAGKDAQWDQFGTWVWQIYWGPVQSSRAFEKGGNATLGASGGVLQTVQVGDNYAVDAIDGAGLLHCRWFAPQTGAAATLEQNTGGGCGTAPSGSTLNFYVSAGWWYLQNMAGVSDGVSWWAKGY